LRLRRYLESLDAWSEEDEAALNEDCEQRVEAEVEAYLGSSAMPPESMFDCLYETLPAALRAQRDEVVAGGAAESAPGNPTQEVDHE